MIIFILRRLLLLLVTLFLLSLLSFSLLYFTPHPPIQDRALLEAYHFYLHSLMQGDLGSSSVSGQDIMSQLKVLFPATIELCLLAFLLALCIGIPLGIIAGLMKGKWQDRTISLFALLGYSVPIFWLALLLMLLFSLHLYWLPISGSYNLLYPMQKISGFSLIDAWLSDSPYRQEIIYSVLHHLILPVLVLSLEPMTQILRLMRHSTEYVISQNYIKAAATRGLSRLTIIRRHLLHNALPPIIPKLGLQFSTLLTLAMITEIVFSRPGLGLLFISAVHRQDVAVISAGVIMVGSLVLLINLLADLVGALMDSLKHKGWYAIR